MSDPTDSQGGDHGDAHSPSDTELLALFRSRPQHAWKLFIERYADFIFTLLRRMGFDYDQAMDRFVYVCEKLCEHDFRRLKTIKYAGSRGDVTPWLRQVVKRLCVNWAWSEEGRRRLLKGVAGLPARAQRVFELYFWQGLLPSEIHERLRLEHQSLELGEVYGALEEVFSRLSQKKIWRLVSGLARARRTLSLDEVDEETGLGLEPADEQPGPEEALVERAEAERVSRAFDALTARERLVIQLRYEEMLTEAQVAEMLGLGEQEVTNLLKAAKRKVRREFAADLQT
jgi:RNA polymerase sigma factor (sigma-70 family)